jgi:hypothetical protein
MPDNTHPQATPVELIERRIYVIRGHRVMLDSDLAELYGRAHRASEQGGAAQP